MNRGTQIPGVPAAVATNYCALAPNICEISSQNLYYVTLQSLRTLRSITGFCKVCAPLFMKPWPWSSLSNHVCNQITKFIVNWRNSERKYEVCRRKNTDLILQSSFNNSIIYSAGNLENFLFTAYILLMTRLKQDSTVVTWQYRRVSTCDTTIHFQGNFPLPSTPDTSFQYAVSR